MFQPSQSYSYTCSTIQPSPPPSYSSAGLDHAAWSLATLCSAVYAAILFLRQSRSRWSLVSLCSAVSAALLLLRWSRLRWHLACSLCCEVSITRARSAVAVFRLNEMRNERLGPLFHNNYGKGGARHSVVARTLSQHAGSDSRWTC